MKPTKSQNARIDEGFPKICLPMIRMYIKVPTAERPKYYRCQINLFMLLVKGDFYIMREASDSRV